MAKIALGTWAWGAGAFGGDKVFGSKTDVENLKTVFDAAMKAGLVHLGLLPILAFRQLVHLAHRLGHDRDVLLLTDAHDVIVHGTV